MAIKVCPPRSSGIIRAIKSKAADSDRLNNPEFIKCRDDAAYFINNYCIIDDTQEIGGQSGVMPFRLWDDQLTTLRTIENKRKIIILKARQLGISWLVCAYVLWFLMFHSGKLALMFSKTEDDAKELIRRISVMYQRLPVWMHECCPLAKNPNVMSIWFKNGSRAKADAATATAGSGETASILVLDELAKIANARPLYTASAATVANGTTKLIALSSAFGTGNLFHDIWSDAFAGRNDFEPIFLPWWSRPGRDQAWYDEQVRNSPDPDEIKQEYPANPIEAFLVSGNVRFNAAWIELQFRHLRKTGLSIQDSDFFRDMDGLTVYHYPDKTRRVGIGADVAEGRENGDFSHAVVVDLDTLEELACLHGKWEGDEFAEKIDALSRAYRSWAVVERNNHGFGVLSKLRSLGNRAIAHGLDDREGWLTNSVTKPLSIDWVAICLRDDRIKIHSPGTLDEMQQYRKLGNGKTGAPEGRHDDRVMAWAVLLGWRFLVEPTAEAHPIDNPMFDQRYGVAS